MEHWKLHFIDCKNHFKVRRTGAIAIGVGAATAVVLSVVGAKTPVVIGSAAALGIAGGVIAGRKGVGKRVSTTKQLVGEELLVKVKELVDVSKSDLARTCGYVTTDDKGVRCINYDQFYDALLQAKLDEQTEKIKQSSIQQKKKLNIPEGSLWFIVDDMMSEIFMSSEGGDASKLVEALPKFPGGKLVSLHALLSKHPPSIEVAKDCYLPKGKYYVGDLSYVIANEVEWQQSFRNKLLATGDGVYSFKGKDYFISGIESDGLYPCSDVDGVTDDVVLMVDCVNIGVIPIDVITDKERMESILKKKGSFVLTVEKELHIGIWTDGSSNHALTLTWTYDKDDYTHEEYIDIPITDEFIKQVLE